MEALAEARSAPFIGTGSRGLDALLGGGYRVGRVVAYFGKSGTGKTQIAMQAALMGAREGKMVAFLDTEGSFRPERVESIAERRGWEASGALERIVYLRTSSAAEQVDAIRRMGTRGVTSPCELVVVDTLTRNFSLDLPGSANMMGRQEALGVHLSEMARDAEVGRRAYVLTNRVTFGAGDSEVSVGGTTVNQLVHDSVRLRRTGSGLEATSLGSGDAVGLTLGPIGID
ncbi:MAG: hypothetical protein HY296_03480 [Thaumarchaeota archaeon]|nr:hypothetical protein [Nitrososphaerota archaeon]